jgi:hypothetical protein
MPPVRALLLAVLAAAGPSRAAELREASGLVQVRVGADSWKPARGLPRPLDEADGVRTGFNATASVALTAGASVEAGGNSHLTVEVDGAARSAVSLLFGSARLSAGPQARHALSLRTPTALVRAREARAAARVTVAGGGGGTVVEVLTGLIGVEDNRGGATLLRAGQRVEVDLRGLRETTLAPTPQQSRRLGFLEGMRRELGFELSRDAELAAASRESRREEREAGRVQVGSDGRRVRVEHFVTRPSAERLGVVVLNDGPAGMSYFSWQGTFDRALPRDLSPVFAALPGSASPTPWTLSAYEATVSNGRDSLVERGEGGHQVDLNANADALDDVATRYDADSGLYRAAGATAYRTLFDRGGSYANGTLKRGWTGANLQSYADATASTTNDPFTGAALGAPLPAVTINTTLPDAGVARRERLESYGDGAEIQTRELSLEFGGASSARSAWGGASSGDALRQALLGSRYERRVTASGFTAPVSLVLPARALAATGQLP